MQKSTLKMPKVGICTTLCKEKVPSLSEIIQVIMCITCCEKVTSYLVEEVWLDCAERWRVKKSKC